MFNKKQKIVLLVCLFVGLVGLVILIFAGGKKATSKQTFTNLDSFLASDPEFDGQKTVKSMGLEKKEINLPLATQNNLQKITMVPVLAVGGDAIYEAIAQVNQNEFTRLNKDNAGQFFVIKTPEEALKYVDFLLTELGGNAYDRARETIWNISDYQDKNCNFITQDSNLNPTEQTTEPLPAEKPVSQARKSGEDFIIDWVYFTPTVPAGYFKNTIKLDKNNQLIFQEKTENPFWACQGGIVF